MADSKLTGLTAVTAATADDILYLVDDPGGTPVSKKITVANFHTDATHTRPVLSGTPAAQGAYGYNTTRDTTLQFDNAWGASVVFGSRVPIISRPNEQLTNSTTNDQDFTSLGNVPANFIIAQRVIRVTLLFQFVSDAAASGLLLYFKLGSTKVYTGTSTSGSNSLTRSGVIQILVFGTAAAGASVNVDTAVVASPSTNLIIGNSGNTVSQPVALATNGALPIVPGLTFATNTGGESVTLLDVLVEALN